MSVSTMRGRYWNSVSVFLLDSLQWRVTWGWVYSLVLEASRQSVLNFRIGFLSSIGGRLPYPCLPTPFPILRRQEALPLSHASRLAGANPRIVENEPLSDNSLLFWEPNDRRVPRTCVKMEPFIFPLFFGHFPLERSVFFWREILEVKKDKWWAWGSRTSRQLKCPQNKGKTNQTTIGLCSIFTQLQVPLWVRDGHLTEKALLKCPSKCPLLCPLPCPLMWDAAFAYNWKLPAYSGAFYLQLAILACLLKIEAFHSTKARDSRTQAVLGACGTRLRMLEKCRGAQTNYRLYQHHVKVTKWYMRCHSVT